MAPDQRNYLEDDFDICDINPLRKLFAKKKEKKSINITYYVGKLIFAFILELPLECKSHANHKSLSGHQQRKAAKDIVDKAENKGLLILVFDSLLSKIALPPPESYSQTL